MQRTAPSGTGRQAKILKGEKPCPRTLARWRRNYKRGEQRYNSGYLGLVDGRKTSGNSLQRLDPATEEFLNEYIKNRVEDLTHASYWVEYNAFALSCEQKGIPACSHITFCAHIRLRNVHEHELKRRGAKGAYPWEPFYFELDLTLPRHGNRPFAIGHLDHTRVDVEIVCYRNGKAIRMGHVWLTLLIDAYTRRILVVYLSYDDPSTDSCMMVLRECVRRWGRLPQTIVVDGGKEFASTYFETLLALYEITKKTRPGKPRYGTVIERMFGVVNEQFFWALKGNTKLMRNVRQVGKKEQPQNRAVWTLPALYARLCQYCYEEYDRMYHSKLADTPRNVFQEGIIKHGFRGTRRIPYSADFILTTLLTTPKGTAKVQLMGLHVNGRYYWHPDMRLKNVIGKSVDVRYDPFDISSIQAYIKGRWVECKAAMDYDLLQGRTAKQAELIAQLWREQSGLNGAMRRRNGMQLAEFLLVLRQNEEFLTQQLKDEEHKFVLDVIHGNRDYTDQIRQMSGQPKASKGTSGSVSLAPVPNPDPASASRTSGNTTVEILERMTDKVGIRTLEDY
jgi:putative transposase